MMPKKLTSQYGVPLKKEFKTLDTNSHFVAQICEVTPFGIQFFSDTYLSSASYISLERPDIGQMTFEIAYCHNCFPEKQVYWTSALLRTQKINLMELFRQEFLILDNHANVSSNDINKEILIVDDNRDLLDAIAFEFKENQFKVHTATSVKQALSILDTNTGITVVVSDIRLPTYSGTDFFKWVNGKTKQLPAFIFMTGYAQIDPEKASSMGAEGYFSKPFDIDGLIKAVKRILVRKHDNHQTADKAKETKQFVIGKGGMCFFINEGEPENFEILHCNLTYGVTKGKIRFIA